MPNYTPNYNLEKPLDNEFVDINVINDNMDKLDIAIENKVDKAAGKGLSTNDYTDADKTKLAGIDVGANNYTHPAIHSPSIIAQDANNRFVTDAEKTAWDGISNKIDKSIFTAAGDIIYSSAANTPVRLPKGTDGQLLGLSGGLPSWQTISVIPAGTVIHCAMPSPPSGFLKCNGATVSRTTYAALFTAIGTAFGVGDGSTTFKLPDLRGEFIRGFDDGRGVDSGRTFGSSQTDELKSHTHTVDGSNSVQSGYKIGVTNGSGWTGTTNATGGTETRPRNIALLACIKY